MFREQNANVIQLDNFFVVSMSQCRRQIFIIKYSLYFDSYGSYRWIYVLFLEN